jgi:hypothetical protein
MYLAREVLADLFTGGLFRIASHICNASLLLMKERIQKEK